MSDSRSVGESSRNLTKCFLAFLGGKQMYIASELLIVLIEIAIIHLYLQGLFVKKALPLWLWLSSYFLFGAAASAL